MKPPTNFHRGTAGQLADFLRASIQKGELSNPLPPSRVWCQRLGVGRPSLLRALQLLEQDGYIKVTPRGAVVSRAAGKKKKSVVTQGVVRFLFLGRNYPDMEQNNKWLFQLSETLHSRGITFSIERCSTQRLRTIAAQPSSPNELFLLASLPVAFQRLFLDRKKPCLVSGYVGPGIALPFLTPDIVSSVRHATQALLRKGFRRVVLFNVSSLEAGDVECIEKFEEACAKWPHQPVRCEVKLAWNNLTAMKQVMNRLVSSLKEPCGFVVLPPAPIGVLVTSLLQHGISIPRGAHVMAVGFSPQDVQFSVPVTLYSVSARAYANELLRVAERYFETQQMPIVRKALLMEVSDQV